QLELPRMRYRRAVLAQQAVQPRDVEMHTEVGTVLEAIGVGYPGRREVAELARVARASFVGLAIEDETAAQAETQKHVEERADLLAGTIPALSDGGRRGIVLQEDGEADAVRQESCERDAFP